MNHVPMRQQQTKERHENPNADSLLVGSCAFGNVGRFFEPLLDKPNSAEGTVFLERCISHDNSTGSNARTTSIKDRKGGNHRRWLGWSQRRL
jgi:hypothetical protein